MFGLGGAEIAVLLVIGLLLFGSKLPSLARYLGSGIVEFRKEMRGLSDELGGRGKDAA